MGSVTYKKRGSSYYIRFVDKGRERSITLKDVNDKTVKNKVAYYKELWDSTGKHPLDEKKESDILNEIIFRFLASNRKNWTQKTYKGYKSVLGMLGSNFGLQRINSMQNEAVSHWVHSLDIKAVSKKNYIRHINSFLNQTRDRYGHDLKIVLDSKTKREARNKTNVKYVTYEELHQICKAHHYIWRYKQLTKRISLDKKSNHARMWWFMFWCLLRMNEVPKIKSEHVYSDRVLVHGKGGKIDFIGIPAPAKAILNELDMTNPLFGFSDMKRSYMHFNEAAKMALGRSLGFHSLRHGGVVHYLSLGKPISWISKLARHEDETITARVYADIVERVKFSMFDDIEDKPV